MNLIYKTAKFCVMTTMALLLQTSILIAAADNSPPSDTVKLIFIHHSTGGNWLADENSDQPSGGLGAALMNNNYYVSATNYGWGPDSIGDSTDIPNWPGWFTGSQSSTVLSALYDETGQNIEGYGEWSRLASDPGGENEIILFKSCFPNSDLFGNPDDAAGSTPNDQYTVSNAKAVYNNLLTYFRTRTDKLFIVITAPPQNENEYSEDEQTPAQRAANARAFNNWLVNDWLDDYPYSNVAVFDYYNILTGTDNHHRWNNNSEEHVTGTEYNFSAYPADEWDSHPSSAGHRKATEEFVDLLNYFYNTWQESVGSGTTSSASVSFSSLVLSSSQPQAGTPVTVTVDAQSDTGETVYYKFFYCANYGTDNYETTPWTVVQPYSTSNTCDYTFPLAGDYIIVVRGVTDTANEPDALPLIGQAVSVGSEDGVNLIALEKNETATTAANIPTTFTVSASAGSSADLYYAFYYCPGYGTASYGTDWTLVQPYSTSNTCEYTFPSEGNYVVVARAVTDPSNEPAALPITGMSVPVTSAMAVTSTAFSEGESIPDDYACNGSEISPDLSISGVPDDTESLVLICDDPDAPYGTFVHWVLFNLPAATRSLSAGIPATDNLENGAIHGVNDFGDNAYGGPCPPSGTTHRYYFKFYALDTTLNLTAGATKAEVEAAMSGHILTWGQLMGLYSN